jgi:hypothetical protein
MGMETSRKNKKQVVLQWLARVLSLPALLFMAGELLFPHADAAEEENKLLLASVGILFLATFSLAIAWLRERVGGYLAWGSLILFFAVYWIAEGEFFPVYWLILLGIGLPAALFLAHDYLVRSVTN